MGANFLATWFSVLVPEGLYGYQVALLNANYGEEFEFVIFV